MRGGGDSDAHNFQEYTYKKITPCDVCSQVLRGKNRYFLLGNTACSSVSHYNNYAKIIPSLCLFVTYSRPNRI